MNHADRRAIRLVPFSMLYVGMSRDELGLIEAERRPTDNHSYSARVAKVVVLSALVVEAAINEIADWLGRHLSTPVAIPEFDALSVRQKWTAVADAVGGRLPRRSAVWRNLETLVELRNVLVHPRAFASRPDILDRLDELGCSQDAMDWFESVMTVATANWAHEVPMDMMGALREMVGERVDLYNDGFSWMWERARLGAKLAGAHAVSR